MLTNPVLEARTRLAMTQVELGRKVGVAPNVISSLEVGGHMRPPAALKRGWERVYGAGTFSQLQRDYAAWIQENGQNQAYRVMSVRLSPEQVTALESYRAARGEDRSAVIRRLLGSWIEDGCP